MLVEFFDHFDLNIDFNGNHDDDYYYYLGVTPDVMLTLLVEFHYLNNLTMKYWSYMYV